MSPTSSDNTAPVELVGGVAAGASKDILIGLSAEIELFTSTTAKGTNKGGKDTAVAEAGIVGEVRFLPESTFTNASAVCSGTIASSQAYPGAVTFASRKQELSVEVELEVESATDLCADCEITGYVEVGLNLTTTAAHHFNFIADLQSSYPSSNKAVFVACWHVVDGEITDGDNAWVGMGKTSESPPCCSCIAHPFVHVLT
jgi:hypothetical protein